MGKYTPEPWKKLGYKDGVCFVMAGCYARGTAPASGATPCIACLDGASLGFGYEQNEANGERIVACVNALANIPDPAAYIKAMRDALANVRKAVELIRHVETLTNQGGDQLDDATRLLDDVLAWDAPRTLSTPESEVKRGSCQAALDNSNATEATNGKET